ncbi:MAG: PhoPQ-activated protein PqaA family protein [Cyclobacteriaceae bacterium]
MSHPFPKMLHRFLTPALFLLVLSFCQPQVGDQKEKSTKKGIEILEAYIDDKDDTYQYELVHQNTGEGFKYYVLKMTSQNWLTTNEVEDPSWWHWVSFVIPDDLDHQTSLLMVTGGNRDSGLPEEPDPLILQAALSTKSPAIKVHNIPFQPVAYQGDSVKNRKEDGLIAFGWREFMESGANDEDAIWLARLPMTKAVVSAMDAVVDYTSKELGLSLGKYVVAGGSKRGWTTWSTAAVDDRVVGMVPIVIDMLNLEPSFKHHWQTYGFWAPAVKDYEREKIFDWMGSYEFQRLMEITEPYHYLDRFKDIPKLLLNASGDQFFLPDSWRFYWESLPGEKHLAYFPNSGHSLDGTDAIQVMLGFYSRILKKENRPKYEWEIREEEIYIKTDPQTPAVAIKLWEAHNRNARDFRISEFGPGWKETQVPISPDGEYHIPIAAPEKGWKGHFVEMNFPGNAPMKVTSGIKVLPETYLYEPFVSKNPKGTPLN